MNKPFRKDLSNQKFGHLTIKQFSHKDKNKQSMWEAKCDCGKIIFVRGSALATGNTTSCGCARKGLIQEFFRTKHGGVSGNFWTRIIASAEQRGIQVTITKDYIISLFNKQNEKCAISGVNLVLDKNLGTKDASLDRIDSSKGYNIGNVQWVHKTINIMKNELSEKDFYMWISRVYLFKKNLTLNESSCIV